MKTQIITQLSSTLVLGVLFIAASACVHAETVAMNLPPGNYATHIGTRSIADPSGATHAKKEIANKVVVGIFTAPNMSQGDTQEKWANLLANESATKISDEVALFLVEDMSQAGMFKGIARSDMKKEFTPKSRPFLILDEDGSVLKKFGVATGRTEILIYDKRGTLRDVENDLADQDKTIHRIKAITHQLLNE